MKSRWAQLRRHHIYTALRRVLQRYFGNPAFRVVHLSIQQTHLHLLVEAADRRALTRGMQSFTINAARAINAVDSSHGKVFAFRYHATQIKTARYARHALAYVLNNWRRHREDQAGLRPLLARVDPYASALTFRGWRGAPRFAIPARYTPLPVSPPQTSLLRSDWRAYGLIDPLEVPGPLSPRFTHPRRAF
jgi:putative transposase